MAELNEAVIKVIAGPEKKSRVVIERERKLTAYHEAGHAIVIHDLPTQDPVHEITIIPRGMAGGMTISLPQEDVTFQTRQQLTERIAVCLGGRAAEQLAFGGHLHRRGQRPAKGQRHRPQHGHPLRHEREGGQCGLRLRP